jgi:hypothetical protein
MYVFVSLLRAVVVCIEPGFGVVFCHGRDSISWSRGNLKPILLCRNLHLTKHFRLSHNSFQAMGDLPEPDQSCELTSELCRPRNTKPLGHAGHGLDRTGQCSRGRFSEIRWSSKPWSETPAEERASRHPQQRRRPTLEGLALPPAPASRPCLLSTLSR